MLFFFFFNDTATTEIYTLSLHDALPISAGRRCRSRRRSQTWRPQRRCRTPLRRVRLPWRSEEHTSELQSRLHLVCRLLLEKKKNTSIMLSQTEYPDGETTLVFQYKAHPH